MYIVYNEIKYFEEVFFFYCSKIFERLDYVNFIVGNVIC